MAPKDRINDDAVRIRTVVRTYDEDRCWEIGEKDKKAKVTGRRP